MPIASRVSSEEVRPLRYGATCVSCGAKLPPRTRAVWNRERREATCEKCASHKSAQPPTPPPIDRGNPGASALREARRRQDRREQRTISAHPRIGKFILAVTDDPQTTRAWQKGGAGEQALGNALETMRGEQLGVLHDRRIPGTKANIDHIVVGPAGVFVIDAKRYSGKLERRDRGWIFDRDWRLYVGGRDQTKLVTGMTHQVDAVRTAISATEFAEVRLFPVLCFIECEVGVFASPFTIGEVRVMWPKPLYALVRSDGLLEEEQIADLERRLALALPCA